MNLRFYLEKLSNSNEFKNFMKHNEGAYLCSGFFVIDKEPKAKGNKQHLDYFVPQSKKVFSFQFENTEVKMVQLENFEREPPEKISTLEIDFTEDKKPCKA